MISNITYSAYGVELKSLQASDLEFLRAKRNDPEMRKWMTTDHEITSKEMATWYSRLPLNAPYFLVYFEGRCVGHVNAKPLSRSTYDPGYMFWDVDFQNCGGVPRAVLAFYDYLFHEVGALRLEGLTAVDNGRAIRLAKGFGFRNCGQRLIKGRNYIVFEQTAIEFQKTHAKYAEILI